MQANKENKDSIVFSYKKLVDLLMDNHVESLLPPLEDLGEMRKIDPANFQKFFWKADFECLRLFYQILCNLTYINIPFTFFTPRFTGDELFGGKLPFNGDGIFLIYTIQALALYGFIKKDKKLHVSASLNFIQTSGIPFEAEQLRTQSYNDLGDDAQNIIRTKILVPLIEFRDKKRLQSEDITSLSLYRLRTRNLQKGL